MRRRLPFAVLLVVLRTTAGMPSLASPLMTFDDGCIALNNCSGRGLCRDGAAIAKPSELPGSAVNYGMAVCLCESHWRGDDCSVRTCVNDCSGRGVCAAVGGGLRLCQCDAGFGGEDCSTRMCPGGCSGHGRCIADNFTCACDAGWTGSSCAEVECSPLADCSGRGTCSGGECLCQGGWEGAACERAACPMSCSGHGICGEDGVCQCRPGFGGVDCSALACPNDCSARGRCLGYGTPQRFCHCDSGYGGPDCAARTCAEPGCGAHGVCVNASCFCEAGWGGLACDAPLCPALGGAMCSGHGECDGFACRCADGWAGPACSARGCIGGCGPRHACFEGACVCAAGWTGLELDCELRSCPADCGGRGQCSNGTCTCFAGFSGAACDERSCPLVRQGLDDEEEALPCAGHGECEGGKCVCEEGWRDFDCARRACRDGCSGQGHCDASGMCQCYPGWFGEDCALPACFRNCSGHGHCALRASSWLGLAQAAEPVCECDEGWQGIGCEARACPGRLCRPGTSGPGQCTECSGRGECSADGACLCASPWRGADCARRGCEPGECGAHGRCLPAAAPELFACACAPGWGGAECTLASCPDDCHGAGHCYNGSCHCYPGHEGLGGNCTAAAALPHTEAVEDVSLRCSANCVAGCVGKCSAPSAIGDSEEELACYAGCTQKCMQVCVVLLTATMSGEWSVGVAVHAGTTRLAYVGLGDVRLESPDERFTPDYVSLQDLCSQNYSRPMSIWIGEDGMLDGGGLLETPHDIWCAFHAAGSSAGSLLGMAWLPAVLALGATSVYELKTWVVRFEEIVARAESLGLTGSLFNYAVLLLWSLLWLLLVMALTAYASLSPGSIGIGEAHFGGSFGLVRAMVLLTSVCGMALGAHTLKLWDARQMGELLQGLKEARALKRSLYVLLLAQLLLYAVVLLQVVDFSALICFVGLAYLDTKAPNLLVAYTLLTVATLPLDAVTLCMLGHPASFLQWARSTAYFFILIFKCCSLVLMGMLHTKVKFALRLRSEPQEEFFGDADQPTARGEYSA